MDRISRKSPFTRTASRRRPARPGSVLVLVIVLLVLMALIGTAWISSTRSDSYAARQNTYNTQIELLVQGTRNLVQAAIVTDLFDGGQYRKVANPALLLTPPLPDFRLRRPPPYVWPMPNPADPPPTERTEYEHYDSPWWDFFLASRMPGLLQTVRLAADSDPARPTLEVWPAVSAPPVAGGRFETPFGATWVNGNRTNFNYNNLPYGYYQRHVVFPDFIDLPTATGGTRRMPAFRIRDQFNPTGNQQVVVLAADADGDGIADSGLWRLPVGQIEGVTYYAAVRVVDNNSAVNAAIASNSVQTVAPYAPFVAIPGDFSPANLMLRNALPVLGEMDNFDLWRFNAQNVADFNAGSALFQPRQDDGAIRNDFAFISRYDALWNQLGRRLDNPGYNGLNANPPLPYRALPIGESMALARNFVVADKTGSRSILEDYLRSALWPGSPTVTGDGYGNTRVPQKRYRPEDYGFWFDDNFRFDERSSNPVLSKRPLRSALVARNPVSNFARNQFRQLQNIPAPPDAWQFGDYVAPGFPGPKLVCINPTLATLGVLPTGNRPDVWALQPWAEAPTKISANTGSFGQLWTAFWSVMVEGRDPNPSATPPGLPFFPAGTINTGTQLFAKPPIRTPPSGTPPTNFALSFYQNRQLRAALAAVNAMDLRDADNDVTSRLVVLSDPTGTIAPVAAMVYGTERQPYLTNVYARNDGTNAYVAVELHNPYPVPIVMSNWRWAAVNRSAVLGPPTKMSMALMTSTAAWINNATSPIIPPLGYAVFASAPVPPTGLQAPAKATLQVPDGTVPTSTPLYVVPELAGLAANPLIETSFGNELALLRPRRDDGLLSRSFDPYGPGNPETRDLDPSNPFNESVNPFDLVPVDSYDFSTMATPAEVALDPALQMEWRYARPTNGIPWTWVYPGEYNPILLKPTNTNQPRHVPTVINPTPASDPLALQSFGGPHPVINPATYLPVPLQIGSFGWAGPGKWTEGTPVFPYGGFARNGDLLQVPFIGAYRLFPYLPPDGILVPPRYDMTKPFLEQNVVSIDSDRARTGNTSDTEEQIGRFCPLYIPAGAVDDYSPDPALHRYAFATHLFDHLTVQSPQEDYLPNTESRLIDPTLVYPAGGGTPVLPAPITKYAPPPTPVPQPVANQTNGQANDGLANYGNIGQYGREDTAPVHGLINVNTAPWPVLAMVPFFPPAAYQDLNGNGLDDHNELIAKAIVYYRDTNDGTGFPHGPFRSLAELNKVVIPGAAAPPAGPGFQNRLNGFSVDGVTAAGFDPVGGDPDDNDGDLSPLGQGSPDAVIGDFESRFQMLTNVSNLLTTRSDSFTVYILVQGWRNVGNPDAPPELVVQRRVAFIADRSVVTPANTSMSITNIPTD